MNCSPKEVLTQNLQTAALELAALYMEYGLNAKAINTLEELVDSGIQTAVTYLAFGDIYRNEGSNNLAKECYTKAMRLASSAEDFQVVVAAKAGLLKIESVLENTEKANRLLEEANAEFKALKDKEQWSELKERLTGLDQKLLFLGGCGDCLNGNGRWLWSPPGKICKEC